MANLLKETLTVLMVMDKTPEDICWIGDNESYCDWNDFASIADFGYDGGFGCQEINPHLVVVGKDWWLERHEYDGSENWEYKELPERPAIKKKPKMRTE